MKFWNQSSGPGNRRSPLAQIVAWSGAFGLALIFSVGCATNDDIGEVDKRLNSIDRRVSELSDQLDRTENRVNSVEQTTANAVARAERAEANAEAAAEKAASAFEKTVQK